jgi:hypothetical protein
MNEDEHGARKTRLVGEHGPELVQLTHGSRVYSDEQIRELLAPEGDTEGDAAE